jgi:hypothetical protein
LAANQLPFQTQCLLRKGLRPLLRRGGRKGLRKGLRLLRLLQQQEHWLITFI